MRNMYDDALAIQEGACNPRAIANSFTRHCGELDTDGIRTNPALRLMVHQLAYLMDIYSIDNDLTTYGELTDICKGKATQ